MCVRVCACISLGCLNALSLYSNASVCFYLNCNFNCTFACWTPVESNDQPEAYPNHQTGSHHLISVQWHRSVPLWTSQYYLIQLSFVFLRPPFLFIYLSLSLSHELSSMCGTNWSYRFKCGLKLIESTPLPPNPSIQFECCAYFWVDVRDGNSKHFSFHLYILCTLCLICFICRVVIYHYTRM